MQVAVPYRLWALIALPGAALILGITSPLAGKQPAIQRRISVDQVVKVWSARQQQIRSVKCDWLEEITIPKGFLTDLVRQHFGQERGNERLSTMGIARGEVVPPQDTMFRGQSSFKLENGEIRYEREEPQWSAQEKKYVPQQAVFGWTGTVHKSLLPNGTPETPWPQATIKHRQGQPSSLHLWPILMLVCPMSSEMRLITIENFKVSMRHQPIGGRVCQELESASGQLHRRLWLDDQRDYLPVRTITLVNGQVNHSLDVQYAKDATGRWLPKGWSIAQFDRAGRIREACRANVEHIELNTYIDSAEFRLEFPPGTRVSDMSSTDRSSEYIVRPNGDKREILRSEIGKSYAELVASDSESNVGSIKRLFRSPSFLLVAGILCSSVAVLVWRRRRTNDPARCRL